MQSTIAAIATPNGAGAIGIVRISGPKAISIANAVFEGKDLNKQKGYSLHFGQITDGTDKIDEVLLSIFRQPKSYTGENMVEISCHGSSYILKEILDLLIQNGAQPAQAGEFTERAFLHGKMDLSQAEAVADLIASENQASHRLALDQLRGGVSSEINELRKELIQFASLLELELDFGEEDVEFADREKLINLIENLQSLVNSLITSFQTGQAIKEGVLTALVGRPNAGKSTLLNTLLNDDRAIISNIPGTTRDTIEEFFELQGVKFRLIDTAGIRETKNTIENLGIERTMRNIEKAKIVVYLYDPLETSDAEVLQDVHYIKDKNLRGEIWVVRNKADLFRPNKDHITISAKNKEIKSLLDAFSSYASQLQIGDQTIITNARHKYELEQALSYLNNAQNGLKNGLSHDLLAFEIRYALKHLGNITGEIDIDRDILGTIFGQFCIGK
ncbi:MAG: tRNA uridine-5-carboxymethylaminomethyl(34) synthesis GTPase MnmE [Bacteroidetes bacterium MED-G17]|nr:MAG: tRNA uridine-5-carboxymethylaminomethyl(34) synthesis GTPase MnmE [Bacteroidetes bacterium MED-G17]